jgi:hypothetical protein
MIKKIKEEFYFNAMFLLTVLTGVILIYSTYAWFSASLNVIISDFNMTTRSTDGLFISLDGVTWSSSVSITENDILSNIMMNKIKIEKKQSPFADTPKPAEEPKKTTRTTKK